MRVLDGVGRLRRHRLLELRGASKSTGAWRQISTAW
jgi:hypothetical protein